MSVGSVIQRISSPDRRVAFAAVAVAGLAGVVLTVPGVAGAVPGSAAGVGPCTRFKVGPGSTATQIQQKIDDAVTERTHPGWATGPTGALQGVVYFKPGSYLLDPISFTAARPDVRLVFDPGVLIRPAAGTSGDLFTLGTAASRATNVSFEAGDGCGTVDYAPSDLSHVWADTSRRGNQPTAYRTVPGGSVAGMANIPVGGQPGWPRSRLAKMWVLDLDPAGQVSSTSDDFVPDVAGFRVTNALGVSINDFVSYQNAARLVNGSGPVGLVDATTSRTTVVMIEPDWSSYTTPDYPAPTEVSMSNVYDLLAPSGWGPEQVRVCQSCHFDALFSHGGIALRWETDGGGSSNLPSAKGCGGPGVSGTASDITGVYGNAVLSLVPHCRANGAVTVTGVKGYSEYNLVFFGVPERVGAGFSSIKVDTVTGCGSGTAATAQHPLPSDHTYKLEASLDAVNTAPSHTTGAGAWSWPSRPLGKPGGLPTDVPPGATYVDSSVAC